MRIAIAFTLAAASCLAVQLYSNGSTISAGTNSISDGTKRTISSIVQFVTPLPTCSPKVSKETVRDRSPGEADLKDLMLIGFGTKDFDCDEVENFSDNCVTVYNPDQKDADADGKGDACNPDVVGSSYMDSRCDRDGDGVPDIKDNCPFACNPDQKFVDVNKNNVNDLCDSAMPKFKFESPCPKRIGGRTQWSWDRKRRGEHR